MKQVRQGLLNSGILILFLTVVLYVVLAVNSYQDIIYLYEIASNRSILVENGAVRGSVGRMVIMLLFCGGLLELYRWGLYSLPKIKARASHLLLAVFLVTGITFATAPFDSGDFAVYINQGWLQTKYATNPLTHTVTDIPGCTEDPMFRPNWSWTPCPYGPGFVLLMKMITSLAGNNYILNVFSIKAFCAAAHLGIACLILLSLRMMASEKEAVEATYLYGFNPYMLLHGVANCHNDILLSFFSCLAIFLYLKRKYLFVILACFLGVSIKYISVVMVPFLVILLARTSSYKTAATSFLLGFISIGLLFFSYYEKLDQAHDLLIKDKLNLQSGNLPSLLNALPFPEAALLFKLASWCLIIGLALYLMLKRARQPISDLYLKQIISDVVLLQALLVCLVGTFSWYLAMFFPLSLLLDQNSILRRFCLLATGLMLFSLMWMGFEDALNSTVLVWSAFILSRCCKQTEASKDQCPAS